MSRMKMRRGLVRVGFLAFVVVATLNIAVQNCMAGQFFKPGGYQECVNKSGGRAHIWSVANYACVKATEKSQNACATWLGPANSSTSTVIVASGSSDTVSVRLWGMCTDTANTSSKMNILEDGGSISCGGSCNFTRTGNWGSSQIGSKSVKLDVKKFIDGAMKTTYNGKTAYYRMVIVDRQHGGNTSMGVDFSEIYLVVDEETPEPQPEPTDTCDTWESPSGYSNASENHGTTSIDIRIRNTNSRFSGTNTWETWHAERKDPQDVIYAMPTDVVAWRTCYWPGVETTANTQVTSVNGNQWGNYTDPLPDNVCIARNTTNYYPVTYKSLFEASKTIGKDWLNKFDITGAARPQFVNDGTGVPGDTAIQERNNSKQIKRGESGQKFTENAQAKMPREADVKSPRRPSVQVWSPDCCPNPPKTEKVNCDENGENCEEREIPCDNAYCCTNTYASNLINADVNFDTDDDSASVIVPYNFINITGVDIGADLVYAGENDFEMEKTWTYTSQRYNSVTRASYATRSPNSKVRLFAYVTQSPSSFSGGIRGSDNGCGGEISGTKQCVEPESGKNGLILNGGESLSGDKDTIWDYRIYNTFDASAGDYACFVSAVWPAEVTGDTVHGDPNWSGAQWRYSTPSCAIIAKRPSFQVWGGDMYTNSTINAITAKKGNVYNYYKNNMDNFTRWGGGSTYYGSWAEEGLVIGTSGGISTGGNFAFASGAALGYNTDDTKAYTGRSNLNCSDIAPLTIANSGGSCGDPSGIGSKFKDNNDNRRELIDYWVKSTQNPTASGAKIIYSNDNSVGNKTAYKKETWIYDVNGTFTITGNIKYEDGYNASSTLRDIPKVIIYANNVNIQCNVTEVDAIIITKTGGMVKTCSNAGGDDSHSSRGNPLKIFGMVITDSIELGRTYGGAAWSGSGPNGQQAAAEVFDFDSSILLWSEFMASAAETDTMQVVYQNEIAPRY